MVGSAAAGRLRRR